MKIAIVAGEPSGDQLGAALIRALNARWQGLEFAGIAGPKMIAEGAQTFVPMDKLAVRGYVEVIRHLPELLRIRRELVRALLADPPDLFIGIDAPDFNLGLERSLKEAGIPTVHYVSPSVWAWKPKRMRRIARAADRVLLLFPFERDIYERAGIPADYVGHPLADAFRERPATTDTRTQLRLAPGQVPIALLPGSRMSELQLHADLFIDTVAVLAKARPELRFFVPLATRETLDYFESRIYAKDARELPIRILFGHATLALQAAEAAIIKSGTSTFEAVLCGCPMVITYRLSPLTYRYVWSRMLLPYVGLPNVIAGEFIVPELLQEDATPANLAQALGNWLDHKAARGALRERFARMHDALACGHDERVVDALAPYLAKATPLEAPPPAPSQRSAALRR